MKGSAEVTQADVAAMNRHGFTLAQVVGRFDGVVYCAEEELYRQFGKWGEQSHRQANWYAILGEEFGEVGKAICEYALAGRGENGLAELRNELIQTAAVALAMAESLDRVGFDGA